MLWDVFCRVIDNYGDIGVSWRLACNLAGRGHQVRLWVDNASALEWMAPGALQNQWPLVTVLPWPQNSPGSLPTDLEASDVWVETFGCDIPPSFVASQSALAAAQGRGPAVWINLEYLSAEDYVERSHLLPSPIMAGPGAGMTRHFFYPGLTPATGGLLRETNLQARQAAFTPERRMQWLRQWGGFAGDERCVCLFCYEPAALPALLEKLGRGSTATHLLVAAGRGQAAVQSIIAGATRLGALQVHYLPHLSHTDFDHLLWACDLNFVRGEDSLVRALWAGRPLVWQVYPQDDGAHGAKLQAYLRRSGASPSLTSLSLQWNGLTTTDSGLQWDWPDLPQWQSDATALRQRLWSQDDLATQLIGFVEKKR